ncbi:hypothetical protein [Sphingobacterium faecium]|nr:hypothetical protein [Sphingobacterium faecium]
MNNEKKNTLDDKYEMLEFEVESICSADTSTSFFLEDDHGATTVTITSSYII